MDSDVEAGGTGSGKDGPSSPQSKVKPEIAEGFATPSKQLTLAKILEKQGSPSEIIKRSSPGAKKQPSLVDVLSGKIVDPAVKAKEDAQKVSLEGVEGESLPKEEIKNGSRDRQFLVKMDIVMIISMAANIG